jgi:hypothetical protein
MENPMPLHYVCRPGERIVADRPDVFDFSLFNGWQSDATLRTAPADLAGLSDEALRGLRTFWFNRDRRLPRDAFTIAMGERIADEFARRHMDTAGRRSALSTGLAA